MFENNPNPCYVGIHWIALTEYSEMSIRMLGFQSFSRYFASFCMYCIISILHHMAPDNSRMGFSMLPPLTRCIKHELDSAESIV